MSAVAIEVRGLCARYGEREVLRDLDLDVREGEVMVIMGGSGSGKSTLLRHLLGLETPAAGTIRVLGEDLSTLSPDAWIELRKKTGVAFQSGALFSSLSVGDNILLPLREHTRLPEETMRIMMRLKLDFVSLADAEALMPAQLSGGMVKRAALARALIMDPKLLFLDEPSAGLDPVVSAGLDELILHLNKASGMTVVVVTHELESAFKIASRIAVLDAGRMRACGTVAEVQASPDDRVQALLQRRVDAPDVDAAAYLDRLTGTAPAKPVAPKSG